MQSQRDYQDNNELPDIIDVEVIEHPESERIHHISPYIREKTTIIPHNKKDNRIVWAGIIVAILAGISLIFQVIGSISLWFK